MGRLGRALQYIKKGIKLSEKKRGIENIDTARIYYYAAKINQEAGKIRDASIYYDQAWRTAMKLLGKNDKFTLLVETDRQDFICEYLN